MFVFTCQRIWSDIMGSVCCNLGLKYGWNINLKIRMIFTFLGLSAISYWIYYGKWHLMIHSVRTWTSTWYLHIYDPKHFPIIQFHNASVSIRFWSFSVISVWNWTFWSEIPKSKIDCTIPLRRRFLMFLIISKYFCQELNISIRNIKKEINCSVSPRRRFHMFLIISNIYDRNWIFRSGISKTEIYH